jgi:archaeosine synthase beta-subunit
MRQIEPGSVPSPIYVGRRTFLGLRDLVVSLYTERCQFQCSYCNLPQSSHPEPMDVKDIVAQIDRILDERESELAFFQQFSIGNEGSILDHAKFPRPALEHLLDRTGRLPNLQVLSLESRPEYIKEALIRDIQRRMSAGCLDITIGFETQDDHLREVVLRKSIRRRLLEDRIRLLGDLGVRLTSYVLLKPGPWMTEQEGIDEVRRTIEYLHEQCRRAGTRLVIYLNPVYAAAGTPLAAQFRASHYQPPRIQSVVEIIAATRELNVPIYTGLWSEGKSLEGGDYRVHDTHCDDIRNAIKHYNKTQDYSLVAPFVCRDFFNAA